MNNRRRHEMDRNLIYDLLLWPLDPSLWSGVNVPSLRWPQSWWTGRGLRTLCWAQWWGTSSVLSSPKTISTETAPFNSRTHQHHMGFHQTCSCTFKLFSWPDEGGWTLLLVYLPIFTFVFECASITFAMMTLYFNPAATESSSIFNKHHNTVDVHKVTDCCW